jgi:hypothetical protein
MSGRTRLGTALVAVAMPVAVVLGGLYVTRTPTNPGCASLPSGATCTRILFVGNSYTAVNDLPTMFATLAWSGGHHVDTGALDPGGATLADHVSAPETTATLGSSRWNIVVLQDQSEQPASDYARQTEMYPAARQLVALVRAAGARPVYYVTFAHRDGWPEYGLSTYAAMQAAIDVGYRGIAAEQQATVAPVGDAWAVVVAREADPALWQADGSHPTTKGTYLAACVFYASVFGQSPVGLSYHGDLSGDEAAKLQAVAADSASTVP